MIFTARLDKNLLPVQSRSRRSCVPESLRVFPCQWNYRPDHCIYGSNCREAEHEGVFILHGNRGVFHDDKQPAFRAVYEAFLKVKAFSLTAAFGHKRLI